MSSLSSTTLVRALPSNVIKYCRLSLNLTLVKNLLEVPSATTLSISSMSVPLTPNTVRLIFSPSNGAVLNVTVLVI